MQAISLPVGDRIGLKKQREPLHVKWACGLKYIRHTIKIRRTMGCERSLARACVRRVHQCWRPLFENVSPYMDLTSLVHAPRMRRFPVASCPCVFFVFARPRTERRGERERGDHLVKIAVLMTWRGGTLNGYSSLWPQCLFFWWSSSACGVIWQLLLLGHTAYQLPTLKCHSQ
jgi:hypothetical protein